MSDSDFDKMSEDDFRKLIPPHAPAPDEPKCPASEDPNLHAEPGEHCDGIVRVWVEGEGYHTAPCLFNNSEECSYWEPRKGRRKTRLLLEHGFGPRYHCATLDLIAEDVVRTMVSDYIARIEDNLSSGQGLYLWGGPGTGKTCILALLCCAAPRAVKYQYAPALFDLLHQNNRESIERIEDCDLLLLDDFGTQYSSDWSFSRFETLVEYRYANRKVTCVSANVSPAFLTRDARWDRIIDRWRDCLTIVGCGNKSLRGGATHVRESSAS